MNYIKHYKIPPPEDSVNPLILKFEFLLNTNFY